MATLQMQIMLPWIHGCDIQVMIYWYFRLETSSKLEENEFVGGEVEPHTNWKNIEAESRESVT